MDIQSAFRVKFSFPAACPVGLCLACKAFVTLSELDSTESIQTGFWSLSLSKYHKAHSSNASDTEVK